MKKLTTLLSLILSSSVFAAPLVCENLKECQDLRDSLKLQLKEVNAQISVLSPQSQAINPINWKNLRETEDGTIWSDVLPGKYVNCLSKKNSAGELLMGTDGYIVCQRDAKGKLLGTSSDNSTITDSDAIRACKSIGGKLPTRNDFQKLGEDYVNLPGMKKNLFWTSSANNDWYEAETSFFFFGIDNGNISWGQPNKQYSVRCVSHK